MEDAWPVRLGSYKTGDRRHLVSYMGPSASWQLSGPSPITAHLMAKLPARQPTQLAQVIIGAIFVTDCGGGGGDNWRDPTHQPPRLRRPPPTAATLRQGQSGQPLATPTSDRRSQKMVLLPPARRSAWSTTAAGGSVNPTSAATDGERNREHCVDIGHRIRRANHQCHPEWRERIPCNLHCHRRRRGCGHAGEGCGKQRRQPNR